MKLKEIPRTATFAWAPNAAKPTVVTGTAAGTIDADFSAATELELWNLDLLDHSVASFTATPSAHVETDARFHDIAVSGDGKFVVGALESGVVETWGLPDLKSVGRNDTAHTSAVKSVAFSPKEPLKFATGGGQGQVFIWDVNNLASPFAPGTAAAQRHDDVESVSWNYSAAQILASGGNKGFASIWDTRRLREVLHLHYNSPSSGSRVPISSVQWHPSNSTKLATASMDDNEPVICIWDLKNVNSPERVLRGHTKGVLSLDWCAQDENLMLSGGRDNSTLLWNPIEGVQLGAYPISVEWAFKTKFNPLLPDLFASASFDGKISVQTLQDTSSSSSASNGGAIKTSSTATTKGDDADFWESDTVMDAAHPSFKLQQPPKWLARPVSAKFGFGGKLVIAANNKVDVRSVYDSVLDESVTKKFSEALASKNFEALSSKTDSTWQLLDKLLKGEEIELPEPPVKAETRDDDDEEEFEFVPQYSPSEPYELLKSSYPSVVAAVLNKDFDSAVSQLIAHDETADALLLASFGGADLVKRAQSAYLNVHAAKKPYLRAASALAAHNLDDLVDNSELAAWPSVLRVVLNEQPSETKQATFKLGKRLVDAGERENALKVYLTGNNVGAAAVLWLDELPAKEKEFAKSGECTAYVAHVRALQTVIEKLVAATSKLGFPSMSDPGADRLYSAFRDYADIIAQQGDLVLAKTFLDMLPEDFAADKQRVSVATEPQRPANTRGAARPNAFAPAPTNPAGGPAAAATTTPFPVASPAAPRVSPAAAAAVATSPVKATRARAGSSTKAPTASRYPANPYAPQGVSPAAASVAASVNAPPAPAPAAAAAAAAVPPPPPVTGAATGAAPAKPFKGWNDIPELPNSARRTPAAPTRVAPARAPATVAPPSASASPRASVSAPPPPPPPAAGARPPSATGTAPGPAPGAVPGAVPAPPAAAPRTVNPYAPSPGSTSRAASVSSKPNPYAPPPVTSPPVAAQPPSRPGSRTAAPPPRARAAPSVAVPPPPAASSSPRPAQHTAQHTAPPPPPPAVSTPPPAAAGAATASAAAPQPAKPVKASGELTDDLKSIKDSLSGELQRVRPVIEAQYAKQYIDTARRLDILYSRLASLSESLVQHLHSIAGSVHTRDYDVANSAIQTISTEHSDEVGEWFTGVKRLVKMSAGVPV